MGMASLMTVFCNFTDVGHSLEAKHGYLFLLERFFSKCTLRLEIEAALAKHCAYESPIFSVGCTLLQYFIMCIGRACNYQHLGAWNYIFGLIREFIDFPNDRVLIFLECHYFAGPIVRPAGEDVDLDIRIIVANSCDWGVRERPTTAESYLGYLNFMFWVHYLIA